MPIQKQPITINFQNGLQTKTDPNQIPVGQFTRMVNASFNKTALLTKRNGFAPLPSITSDTPKSLTTYSGGLVALGNSLNAYSQDTSVWTKQGTFTPIDLSVLSAVRGSTAQTVSDVAVASNGLACVTFVDSTLGPRYQIIDSATGQIVVPAVNLPTGAALPRVFANGNNIVITYLITISTVVRLQYIAIPISLPASPLAAVDISTQVKSMTAGYDGCVASGALYLAWQGSDAGGAVRATSLDANLNLHTVVPIAGYSPTVISVAADVSSGSPLIWLAFLDATSGNTYAGVYSANFGTVKSPFLVLTAQPIVRITSVANAGRSRMFYEVPGTYSYAVQAYQGGAYTNVSGVANNTVGVASLAQAGTVTSNVTLKIGAGLATKAFRANGANYVLLAYQSTYQNSYLLVDQTGLCVARLAYENGGGYRMTQILSNVNSSGNNVTFSYLFADFITSLSPGANQSPVGGIYTQTGVNICSMTVGGVTTQSTEIGSSLHLTGGQLWMYDGAVTVEHGFELWPDNIGVTTATTGGSMTGQQYFYQVCYEWTDNQGMLHRSAPSVPVSIVVPTGTTTNTVTLNIPTLKFTAKSGVRIVIYRWSTANQSYYQVTSVTSPTLNNPATAFISYTDTQVDSAIQGNALIYTTGSVVEDIAAPACNISTLFKSRLFVVDAEDPNTIWFSKQVIAGTPVEMSDLLTLYIAPTSGAQGSTGAITALSAMDDKLVIFKRDAIYYITGTGPDNTGANNDFSDPVFITSSVGCSNPGSIVLMPGGVMFQSDKGIWLLGRDLSTTYIGAPVEAFNAKNVLSALNVPGTNEVRFTLDSGELLVFDYFSNQWGSYENVPAIGSTIFGGLHTYLNAFGQVYQETIDAFLDAGKPISMSFTTGWITLTGLQGYQRLYEILVLGQYFSPHTLQVGIAYNYAPAIQQVVNINPTNSNAAYGSGAVYGSSATYGVSDTERWRIFPAKQKCEAIQLTFTETYDPSKGLPAGAGLSISGLTLVVGAKKGYAPRASSQTAG